MASDETPGSARSWLNRLKTSRMPGLLAAAKRQHDTDNHQP